MNCKIIITPFNQELSTDIFYIIQDSFRSISVDQRPTNISIQKIINTFSEKNPAGQSLIAFAVVENKKIAMCAAIPFRIKSEIKMTISLQIGSFFVCNDFHGMGIGSQLLKELTNFLSIKSYIYSYPNNRSIGLFTKNGYKIKQIVPSYIVLPILSKIFNFFYKPKKFKYVTFNHIVDMNICENKYSLIVKDKKDFIWKYSNADNYEFILIEKDCNDIIYVLTSHKFLGIKFKILLDIYNSKSNSISNDIFDLIMHLPLKSILYFNSSHYKKNIFFDMQLFTSINPRNIVLVERNINNKNLHYETFTSDWMGF